jgi:hypothetical protein
MYGTVHSHDVERERSITSKYVMNFFLSVQKVGTSGHIRTIAQHYSVRTAITDGIEIRETAVFHMFSMIFLVSILTL